MDRHIIREDLKVRNMGITAAAEVTPAFFVRVDRLFCGRPAAWNSLYQTTCGIRHVPLTVFAGT